MREREREREGERERMGENGHDQEVHDATGCFKAQLRETADELKLYFVCSFFRIFTYTFL